jgi:hypothetical protein
MDAAGRVFIFSGSRSSVFLVGAPPGMTFGMPGHSDARTS